MRLAASVFVCAFLTQLIALLIIPVPALADVSGVLVSELQTASGAHAGDEFVELYNPTAASADLGGWKLEYHSATNADCTQGWTTKATVAAGAIASHGFYLFSATGYLTAADTYFSSGLAPAGAVRLVNAAGGTEAALAWGDATPCGNGNAATAPPAGSSLERRPGADVENGGNAYNTGDDATDFLVRTTPAPQSIASPTEDPVANYTPSAPNPGAPGTGGATGTSSGDSAPSVALNELLPDPAAPLTDAHDEFIEIYNPNAMPVDLAGYVVKTGASLTTKHTLPDVTVPADGYLALISGTTKIELANSGSSVALFDPAGNQLGQTVTYPKAPTGDAWALNGDTWVWTTSPTPSAANLITAPAATATSASKSTSVPKTKTTKAKSTKSTAAKALKAAKATVASAAAPVAAVATTPGGRWLLFALAGLTIAYVIYEFRYDVRDIYFKFRGHSNVSSPSGQTSRGRRRARAGE